MTAAIRWYLCPLVAHPNGDPASPSVPHAWARAAAQGLAWVALPGGTAGLVRLRGDSAALDGLVSAGAPTGFRRLPLAATWGQLPNAAQTFVTNTWPTVASQMQAADSVAVLVRRLIRLVLPTGDRSDFAQPATDGAAGDA